MDRECGGTAHQHGGQREDVVESRNLGRGASRGGALEPQAAGVRRDAGRPDRPDDGHPRELAKEAGIVSSPLATPEYWGGAAPRIALLLGDWNTPHADADRDPQRNDPDRAGRLSGRVAVAIVRK